MRIFRRDMSEDNKKDIAKYLGEELEDKFKPTCVPEEYGLCATCTNFFYTADAYKVIFSFCIFLADYLGGNPIKLDSSRPVKDCTKYNKVGTLSLWDMEKMATIIDVKSSVGFK